MTAIGYKLPITSPTVNFRCRRVKRTLVSAFFWLHGIHVLNPQNSNADFIKSGTGAILTIWASPIGNHPPPDTSLTSLLHRRVNPLRYLPPINRRRTIMRAAISALFNSMCNILGVVDAATTAAHTAAGGLTPYAKAFASVGEMINDTVDQERQTQLLAHKKLLENI